MYSYIWVCLKSKFRFFTTKSSKTGHNWDNFYSIKKLVRILLDNLIKKVCKISNRLDENCFTYAASRFEKTWIRKKNRHGHHFEKKITKIFFISLNIWTIKAFGQISLKKN